MELFVVMLVIFAASVGLILTTLFALSGLNEFIHRNDPVEYFGDLDYQIYEGEEVVFTGTEEEFLIWLDERSG